MRQRFVGSAGVNLISNLDGVDALVRYDQKPVAKAEHLTDGRSVVRIVNLKGTSQIAGMLIRFG
jgi:hypothetical protein